MSISPARATAFDILLRVERESSYASELLHSAATERLSRVDHALATELVMGVLRWRSLLDSRIAEHSSQKLEKLDLEVLTALRLAIYQLGWLTRIPARAAIYESVELVKRARKRSSAPFVNAILRKLAAQAIPQLKTQQFIELRDLARALAHPSWLVKRWTADYGFDAAVRICRHDQTIPITVIRLRDPDIETQLSREGITLAPGKLLSSARLVESGDFTCTNAFREGRVSIQDEASQLVAALVNGGSRILDCCAAPGGKTRAIAERNANAQITAVELHPHRARLLQTLLSPGNGQGASNLQKIQIVAADVRNLPFTTQFDRVLADVPCSGTGTLARHPEIKWRLQLNDLADLHERQCAILRSALSRLEARGRLIYSTCSLEREENEDVVEKIMAENQSVRVINCHSELQRLREEGELIWPDLESLTRGPYLRSLPGTHPSDGFFAAILEKS